MIKKIIAAIIAFIMGSSASSGGMAHKDDHTYTKDGIVYKNYCEDVCDGFCYETKENVTGVFIVGSNGIIYSLDDDYFTEFDSAALLNGYGLKPHDFIKLTYDVQYKTGGEAGVREASLLKVTACNTITRTAAVQTYGDKVGKLEQLITQ